MREYNFLEICDSKEKYENAMYSLWDDSSQREEHMRKKLHELEEKEGMALSYITGVDYFDESRGVKVNDLIYACLLLHTTPNDLLGFYEDYKDSE